MQFAAWSEKLGFVMLYTYVLEDKYEQKAIHATHKKIQIWKLKVYILPPKKKRSRCII